MAASYDFIVVGAGASGTVLASRLASTPSRPSVLLLEAGGPNNDPAHLSSAERFNVAFTANSPFNWNFKTVPQNQLSGQELDQSRGKGLGGTTAINFCGWIVGPRDDYDEWARLVGDDNFGWVNAKKCLDRITRLHPEIPEDMERMRKYVDPNREDHSSNGRINITYGHSWPTDISKMFIAAEQSGLKTNKDPNAGNPLGMGMGTITVYKDRRISASVAYLDNPPPNLTICTASPVARVVFKGKKTIGIETNDGRAFFASKEVIISGGALSTPQILLLSGIGPQEELEQHGIPVVHHLPMVGKNLRDHCFSSVGIAMTRSAMSADDRGRQCPSPMYWGKLSTALASPEFDALPAGLKQFLQKPTVPSFEIATHTPPAYVSFRETPELSYLGAMCLVFNPQSRGTVTLRSSDPSTKPVVDPRFLTHPFDRRVIIDGVRETMRMLSAPVYAAHTVQKLGPKDDSDEAIWKHVLGNLRSSWHASGTATMGMEPTTACVDSNFRVFGLERLRIVDLSVCPFTPNNHTQSTAYVLGEIAAEKLVEQYRLNVECR